MKKELKMELQSLLAVVLVSACAAPAFAQNTATPNIDQRQVNQEKRIDNGVKSGQLSAQETRNLDQREARIEADKQAAKADGKVTLAERRHLQREENRASRAIYAKKHNRRVAP